MGIFDQAEYDLRLEWGLAGVETLAPISDAVIIVDVLSFCTSVDVAVSRGAAVFPYPYRDERAAAFAQEQRAELATPGRSARMPGDDSAAHPAGYSLSPESLLYIPAGTRLVLPSPNGATLSMKTGSTPTFAGCLRNAAAVAQAARVVGKRIAVIPAGERWPDGTLRPAAEDWIGAGAILNALHESRSPEAELAATAFTTATTTGSVSSWLERTSSGKELIARGFATDVQLAAELNISLAAPRLQDGAYQGTTA